MNNTHPIGIFDSGVGGLSILQHIRQLLPQEQLLYVADSGHGPYGCKGEHFIEQRSRLITEYLIGKGAKAIVIACNTATASTIEKFRHDYGIPFIGVEPGIKPAVEQSKNGHIGVMATTATLASERYKELCQRLARTVELHNQPSPGLADQVEAGDTDSARTQELLQNYLNPLVKNNIDTLVLGCTHYSFLRPQIEKLVNEPVRIVDTSRAVAEQLERVLAREALLNSAGRGNVSYFTSGSMHAVQQVMERLLGHKVQVNYLH